jgi:predicted phage tail protein
MQLGKLHHSQVDQEDSCKTEAIELQSDQRVTRAAQNIADRALRAKPIYHSVYIGRERLGRYVQTGPKKYKTFDAKDRPLGNFRVRARALAAIDKARRAQQ